MYVYTSLVTILVIVAVCVAFIVVLVLIVFSVIAIKKTSKRHDKVRCVCPNVYVILPFNAVGDHVRLRRSTCKSRRGMNIIIIV